MTDECRVAILDKFKILSLQIENRAAAFNYLYGDATQIYTAFASYDYRLSQKVRARFQLNVANLLDDDKPQWTSYGVLGANAIPGGNPRMT